MKRIFSRDILSSMLLNVNLSSMIDSVHSSLVLWPTAEDVSAFGQHQKFPPDARKTFGTQDTQSAAQYIKHYSCFIYLPSMSDIEEISAKE